MAIELIYIKVNDLSKWHECTGAKNLMVKTIDSYLFRSAIWPGFFCFFSTPLEIKYLGSMQTDTVINQLVDTPIWNQTMTQLRRNLHLCRRPTTKELRLTLQIFSPMETQWKFANHDFLQPNWRFLMMPKLYQASSQKRHLSWVFQAFVGLIGMPIEFGPVQCHLDDSDCHILGQPIEKFLEWLHTLQNQRF